MEKKKDYIITIIFMSILIFFMGSYLLKDDKDISTSERRKLAHFPDAEVEDILDGDFFNEFEKYLMDQSIFRDELRHLKSISLYDILKIKDKNDIYIYKEKLYKMEYPLNEKSIKNAADVFNTINKDMLKGLNVYYSIIPDKSYFVSKEKGYLGMDYDKLEDIMIQNISNMKYIDIFDDLSLEDYYDTDLHWKQDKIINIAEKFLYQMNDYKNNSIYYSEEVNDFEGSYYGQAAMFGEKDTITYLTNDVINDAIVFDKEKNKYIDVYNLEDLSHPDKYDIFLGGPKALLTIENKKCTNDKELFIFRDSFGSSLAPLLIKGYSKITMIDLRYISRSAIKEYVEFKEGSDVLFLYSTLILNNSSTISQ